MDTMIHDVVSSRTSSRVTGASHSTSPSALSMRRMARGATRIPRLANVV
jgi:hypothetical protein